MDSIGAAKEVIIKEGYHHIEVLLQDQALMIALSKIEQYKGECDYFEHKYGMNFKEFESSLRLEKEKEDFEKEDDIDDWEFAVAAYNWWEEKVNELRTS